MDRSQSRRLDARRAEVQEHPSTTSHLEDRLLALELSRSLARLFNERRLQSEARLVELGRRLRDAPHLNQYENLCIYAAGSYARGEASGYSDLDLFFLHNDVGKPAIDEPNLKGIRVVSRVIREIEEGMEFPAPSNDGQFLNIAKVSEVLNHLGGSEDDYRNHFTARMLLLLESKPVYGAAEYRTSIDHILTSYLRDYEDHAAEFRPTFLVNDILRFWRTLCLNYEHRRNQADQARKTKQKIRNFKLGFSRLATCFSTVSILASYNHTELELLREITTMRPLERLLTLAEKEGEVRRPLKSALELYGWFLEKTGLPTEDLEGYFQDKGNRTEAFERANQFGQFMFDLLLLTAGKHNTLRYLVI